MTTKRSVSFAPSDVAGPKKRPKQHNVSLEAQLRQKTDAEVVEARARKRQARKNILNNKKTMREEEDDEEEQQVPESAMELARSQQQEEALLLAEEEEEEMDSEDDGLDEGDDLDMTEAADATNVGALSFSETQLVDSFINTDNRRTLADIILAKIAEKENGQQEEEDDEGELPAKVVAAYQGMIPLLSRYRSGKLPKAFKVIPALERWDEILWLTRPDLWSPHCCQAATKVFASNLDPARAKVFYNEVLLERCRDDIRANKKLNYHLYQALYKALFKPAAWFKGILLPLCSSGDATLSEALIFGSVLAKGSVPPAHAAVVILKLAQTKEYSGASSVFLIVLLNKNYTLPISVISALVDYFHNFVNDDRKLPVLWHQSLLVFVQRYSHNISNSQSQKDKLKATLKHHVHPEITQHIRRELLH